MDIETRLLRARVALMLSQPFIGQVAMHLVIEEASGWCKTAATCGNKFYYNTLFVESLSDEELQFLYGHEVLHVVLDQINRRGDREKKIWGMAADYIINYILVRDKVGKMPKMALYDANYTDAYSTEQLYDLLKQNNVPEQETLDAHVEPGDTGDDDGDGAPTLTAKEQADWQETVSSLVMQALQAGKESLGLQRLLNKLHRPKINWRRVLNATLRSTVKHDYTYQRLSRRSWSTGLLLPAQTVLERVVVTAWLDGSASTTQAMVTDFLSECAGIMRTFRDFELTIGSFDVQPYNVQVFTPRDANKIAAYAYRGGGGTAPSCCWDYMRANKLRPHRLLILGDGHYGNDWGEPGYADTTFVIHSNPDATAPYGRTIHYEI